MADNKRHMVRAAVYLVVEDGGKVLLLRRWNTGYRDGKYTLPAGHVEIGETFMQTAVRELKEEVCLDVKPEDLHLVHVMQRHENGVDVIDYYFSVKKWSGEPKIGEPHKADDVQWVSYEEISGRAIYFVNKALKHAVERVLFSHDGIKN